MEENCEKYKEILSMFEHIFRKNETIQEERAKRGEFFNIFNVLKIKSDEVRLHSAFIAELLNPKGSHGIGDKFLLEFLKNLTLRIFKPMVQKYVLKSI